MFKCFNSINFKATKNSPIWIEFTLTRDVKKPNTLSRERQKVLQFLSRDKRRKFMQERRFMTSPLLLSLNNKMPAVKLEGGA